MENSHNGSNQKEVLLEQVLDIRKKIKELDGLLSEAKQSRGELETKLIQIMDDSNEKSFKHIVFNCNVIRKETLYVSIDKEKKDEAFRWIEEDCGRKDMIKPAVHNKTLSSFIGNRLKEGETVPQEIFKYFFKPELSIVMSK